MRRRVGGFRGQVVVVLAFAVAMAYLEAACVAYLQRAIGMTPTTIFPVRDASSLGGFAAIEVGREAATLVMLWAVGRLLGSDWLAGLAWTAIAFGTWDIAYYGWLDVFLGWPRTLGTWDLLFLIPAPWTGPVWSPIVVSIALIGFGLVVVRRDRRSHPMRLRRFALLELIGSGAVVLLAFLWNAQTVIDGRVPTAFPWPLFLAGMAGGMVTMVRALRAQ